MVYSIEAFHIVMAVVGLLHGFMHSLEVLVHEYLSMIHTE